jgi:hypothetical protein
LKNKKSRIDFLLHLNAQKYGYSLRFQECHSHFEYFGESNWGVDLLITDMLYLVGLANSTDTIRTWIGIRSSSEKIFWINLRL